MAGQTLEHLPDHVPRASAGQWEAFTTASGSWGTTLRLGLLLVLRRLPVITVVLVGAHYIHW